MEGAELVDDLEAHVEEAIWNADNVVLTTVGVDIGSTTSHLMFSRIHLRRLAQPAPSRFSVIDSRPLYRSPIVLTPYRADGLIDAENLRGFFASAYREAGIKRAEVDAGAVILTGLALDSTNARAIADLFAAEGGRFVSASAGHRLEATMAAHGSGAVNRSQAAAGPVLNVDVGGATTKFALCDAGQVLATMAIDVGARLVVLDAHGRVTKVARSAALLANELGIPLKLNEPFDHDARRRLAAGLADRIVGAVRGQPGPPPLAGHLPAEPPPTSIVLSGGVAELIGSDDHKEYGDLGAEVASALVERIAKLGVPLISPAEPIRATVIGVSQFSIQLSGNTVHHSGPAFLPVHNVPVVSVDAPNDSELDLLTMRSAIEQGVGRMSLGDRQDPVAIALRWSGEPSYHRLHAVAAGIADAHLAASRHRAPLIVVVDADVGLSLGNLIAAELDNSIGIVVIDGVELNEFDFIDIDTPIQSTNVFPVVVKSLLFPALAPLVSTS